jgi:hemerythrin superfamily protein
MNQAKTMNILSLIESEHRQIEKLFAKLEAARNNELYACFNQLYKVLSLHTRAEETVFYPAIQKHEETKKYLRESEEEHEKANTLLEEIQEFKPTDPEFKSKMNQLKKAIQQHIQKEETQIFSAVRKCINQQHLATLARDFQRAKAELEKDVDTALIT